MKQQLFISLLKERNLCLLRYLVILIFILIFNLNHISYCMEGPKNFPEALKEAADNQDLPEIANILRSLNDIIDPAHRQNIQNILNRHLALSEQYQINTQTFTVTAANTGNIPLRSWNDILVPILLGAGLTLSIWLIVRYYDNLHELFVDVGGHVVNMTLLRDFQLVRHSPQAVREIGIYLMQHGLLETQGLAA